MQSILCHRTLNMCTFSKIWSKNVQKYFSTSIEPAEFKAAVLHQGKQSLTIETMVNREKLSDGMLRIGIDYYGLNNVDVKCMSALQNVTRPFIPGTEFAGEILEIGPNCVQKLQVGDKIAVLSDEPTVGGAMSQQCIVDENACIPLDNRITARDAVSLIQGYGNALLAFSKYCHLKENDDILVIAGAGGNGLAAIEIAKKIYKANVFVVFDSSSVKALIRDECAYRAINAQAGLSKVYKFLDKTLKQKKVKTVYDTVGSGLLYLAADFVEPTGHFLTDDPFFDAKTIERPYFKKVTAQSVDNISTSTEWISKVQIVNLAKLQLTEPIVFRKCIDDAFNLFADEKILPFISNTYSLKDANKATKFIQSKKCLGKVLIDLKRNRD